MLILSHVLLAKSIVANAKNRNVGAGSLFYDDLTEHLKKFKEEQMVKFLSEVLLSKAIAT